jgi:hypothetical protein
MSLFDLKNKTHLSPIQKLKKKISSHPTLNLLNLTLVSSFGSWFVLI